MRFKVILLLLALVFAFISTSNAQVFNSITKEDIVTELEKRNLDYAEVEEALLEKGINLNTLVPEFITYEQRTTIQSVILELSKKKGDSYTEDINPTQMDSLRKKELQVNFKKTQFRLMKRLKKQPKRI